MSYNFTHMTDEQIRNIIKNLESRAQDDMVSEMLSEAWQELNSRRDDDK